MQVKLFSGASPEDLEKRINQWLDGMIEDTDGNVPAKVWIHNIQQYTIGQVDQGIFARGAGPQQVMYTFCLLIFFTISSI